MKFSMPEIDSKSVLQARLQLFGAKKPSSLNTEFAIHTVVKPSAVGNPLQLSQLSQESVMWTKEDDDWESGSVWVSPDISSIVKEAINAQAQELEIVLLASEHSSSISFFATDESKCLAPAIFLSVSI